MSAPAPASKPAIDPLLTIEDLAERMQCTYRCAYQRVWRREIESIRLGRDVRVRESALEAYLQRNTTPAIRQSVHDR